VTLPAVSLNLVAYVGGKNNTGAALPGQAIVGLEVELRDQASNSVVMTTTTDLNGHAGLSWPWKGAVWVSLPQVGWGRLINQTDVIPADGSGPIPLLIDAQMDPYDLPGIIP